MPATGNDIVGAYEGSGTGVQFVRYTMLTTQGQDAGLCPAGQPPTVSGCVFMDSTELAVYGGAATS